MVRDETQDGTATPISSTRPSHVHLILTDRRALTLKLFPDVHGSPSLRGFSPLVSNSTKIAESRDLSTKSAVTVTHVPVVSDTRIDFPSLRIHRPWPMDKLRVLWLRITFMIRSLWLCEQKYFTLGITPPMLLAFHVCPFTSPGMTLRCQSPF